MRGNTSEKRVCFFIAKNMNAETDYQKELADEHRRREELERRVDALVEENCRLRQIEQAQQAEQRLP